MHESADRLTREILGEMKRDLPGEITGVKVETSKDVTRAFTFDSIYHLIGGAVERVLGIATFVPEPATHNERSSRRQTVAAEGPTSVPVYDPEDPKKVLHFAVKEREPEPEPEPEEENEPEPGDEIDATDAAREEAAMAGVDLSEVAGTGAGGRITVQDVRDYVAAVNA